MLLAIAFFWLSVFPLRVEQPLSWLALLLLFAAAIGEQRPARIGRDGFSLIVLFGAALFWIALWHPEQSFLESPFFLICFLVFQLGKSFRDGENRRFFPILLFLALFIQVVFAASQQWSSPSPADPISGEALRLLEHRSWGLFVTANLLGSWAAMLLPLVVGLMLDEDDRLARALSTVSILFCLLLLYWSASFGALLSLLVLFPLILYFWIRRGGTLRWHVLIPLLSIPVLILSAFIKRKNGFNELLLGRSTLWAPALRALAGHPWIGFGPAFSEAAYRGAQDAGGFGAMPHQILLSLALSLGCLGMAGILTGILIFLFRAYRYVELYANPWRLGALGALFVALIHAQFEINLNETSLILWAFLLAGIILSPTRDSREAESTTAPLTNFSGSGAWNLYFLFGILLFYHGGLVNWVWVGLAMISLIALLRVPLPDLILADSKDGIEICFFALLLWAGGSLAESWNLDAGLQGILFSCLALFGFAFLRRAGIPPFRSWRLYFIGLAGISSCLVLGSALWGAGPGSLWAPPLQAVHWLFPNQNLWAVGVLLPALFLFLAQIWIEGFRWPLAMAAMALSLVLAYCGSRGASLAALLGIFWMGFRGIQTKKFRNPGLALKVALSAGFLALILLAPGSTLRERFLDSANPATEDPYRNFRPQIWASTYQLFLQKPLQGQGLGSFPDAIQSEDIPSPQLENYKLLRYRIQVDHAHNDLLEELVELGLPGVFLAGLAIFFFWRRRFVGEELHYGELAAEAVIVSILFQAAVDFDFHNPYMALVFLGNLAYLSPLQASFGRRSPQIRIAALALFAFLGLYQYSRMLQNSASERDLVLAQNMDPCNSAAQILEAEMLCGMNPVPGAKIMRLAESSLEEDPRQAWLQARVARIVLLLSSTCPSSQAEILGQLSPIWDELCRQLPHASDLERLRALAYWHFAQAESLMPHNVFLVMMEADAHSELKEEDLAKEAWRRALAIEPMLPEAWYALADAARRDGKRGELHEALLKLREIEEIPTPPGDVYSASIKHIDWLKVHLWFKEAGIPYGGKFSEPNGLVQGS